MQKSCKTPCKGCPFRNDSLPGWLGGYDGPAHFLDVHFHSEQVNPCHNSVDYEDGNWKEKFEDGDAGRRCRGQAIFFANQIKLPRNPDIERVDKDRSLVFSSAVEFIEHHEQGMSEWLKTRSRS